MHACVTHLFTSLFIVILHSSTVLLFVKFDVEGKGGFIFTDQSVSVFFIITNICWPWFTHSCALCFITQSDNPLSESPALSGCARLTLLFTLQSCLITVYHPPHCARGQTVGNEWCIPPYVVQKDGCSKLLVSPCLETRWAFLCIKHGFKNSQIFTAWFCFVLLWMIQ